MFQDSDLWIDSPFFFIGQQNSRPDFILCFIHSKANYKYVLNSLKYKDNILKLNFPFVQSLIIILPGLCESSWTMVLTCHLERRRLTDIKYCFPSFQRRVFSSAGAWEQGYTQPPQLLDDLYSKSQL